MAFIMVMLAVTVTVTVTFSDSDIHGELVTDAFDGNCGRNCREITQIWLYNVISGYSHVASGEMKTRVVCDLLFW